MRGVELRFGIKFWPDQEIIIEVMELLMDNMEAALKREGEILERRDLTKKWGLLHDFFVALLMGS